MNKENLRQISSLIVAGSILSTPISAIPEQPVSRSLNSTEYETRLASANIQARINSQPFSHQGEYLNTQLGERTTFTCRRLIVPNKAYNQPLTTAELKRVETTWVDMNIDIPENMTGVIFAHGLRQDDKKVKIWSESGIQVGAWQGFELYFLLLISIQMVCRSGIFVRVYAEV